MPKEKFIVEKKSIHFPVVACVGAIDEIGRLLQFSTFEKSVDRVKFIEFLEALKHKVDLRGATMFLDNLNVHHSNDVKRWAQREGLHLLFNAPYSCRFNPIETLWAFAKKPFFNEELMIYDKLRWGDVEERARKHVEAVSQQSLYKCVRHVVVEAGDFLQELEADMGIVEDEYSIEASV